MSVVGTISLSIIVVSILFCIASILVRVKKMNGTGETEAVSRRLECFILAICIIAVLSLALVQNGPIIQITAVALIAGSGLLLNYISTNNTEKEVWSPRKNGKGAHYLMQTLFIVALAMSMVSFAISLAITTDM